MTSDTHRLAPPPEPLATDPREGERWAEWLDNLSGEGATTRDTEEPMSEGATLLLDLVAAVDYLRRGLRPEFTVWDALEEALRWHTAERVARTHGAPAPDANDLDPEDPDPLGTQLRQLLEILGESNDTYLDETMQRAVRRWSTTMSRLYNAGHAWPHPVARQAFPPLST